MSNKIYPQLEKSQLKSLSNEITVGDHSHLVKDPQVRSAQNVKGKNELGKSHFECCERVIKETTVQIDTQQSPKWPFPFDDDFSRGNNLPIEGSGLIDLSSNLLVDTVLKELDTMKKLTILFKHPLEGYFCFDRQKVQNRSTNCIFHSHCHPYSHH